MITEVEQVCQPDPAGTGSAYLSYVLTTSEKPSYSHTHTVTHTVGLRKGEKVEAGSEGKWRQ